MDPVADKLLLSGTIFILWLNEYIPVYIFIIFFGRDIIILVGAAIHMTLIETDAPLPNILGKITTTLQLVYIILIMLLEILQYNITLIALDIFIILITLLSLFVYSKSWLISLNKYHNEQP